MIDDLLDRLDGTLRAKGLPALEPATDTEGLATAVAQVAPLTFPPDVARFWERVDPLAVQPTTFPPLMPPAAGVVLRGHSDGYPRCLFPLAYESWSFLLVELPTGEVWSWDYAAASFRLAYRGLTDLLRVLTATIDEGAFSRVSDLTLIDIERFRELSAQTLAAHGPHPLYPDGEVPSQDTSWPEHWLLSNGVTPEARALRGATHTIAELLSDEVADGTTATIAAEVNGLGGDERGDSLHVSDGTGEMRLYSPAASHTGTRPTVFARFEFDIVIRREAGAVTTGVRLIESVPPR